MACSNPDCNCVCGGGISGDKKGQVMMVGDVSEKESKKNCEEMVKVKFCPKCKSFKVKYVFGLSSWLGMSPRMRCGGCNLEMPSFPVLEISKKELEKNSKKKKETSGGRNKK